MTGSELRTRVRQGGTEDERLRRHPFSGLCRWYKVGTYINLKLNASLNPGCINLAPPSLDLNGEVRLFFLPINPLTLGRSYINIWQLQKDSILGSCGRNAERHMVMVVRVLMIVSHWAAAFLSYAG